MDEAKLTAALSDLMAELQVILAEIKAEKVAVTPVEDEDDLKPFFDSVRKSLFGGRLTDGQVTGMKAKIAAFREAGFPLSWAAYALATSYHETAQRMMPVREGLNASDAWRRAHLRYYPWYGRGDVQLTWEDNYKRADRELGLGGKLVKNLDYALDPGISAKIMVSGMKEGWFSKDRDGTPRSLSRYLKKDEESKENFTQARRIINLMDKAALVAGYAVKFQTGLKATGYRK